MEIRRKGANKLGKGRNKKGGGGGVGEQMIRKRLLRKNFHVDVVTKAFENAGDEKPVSSPWPDTAVFLSLSSSGKVKEIYT